MFMYGHMKFIYDNLKFIHGHWSSDVYIWPNGHLMFVYYMLTWCCQSQSLLIQINSVICTNNASVSDLTPQLYLRHVSIIPQSWYSSAQSCILLLSVHAILYCMTMLQLKRRGDMLHFLHTFSQGYWVPQHTTGYRLLQEMFKNLSIRNCGNFTSLQHKPTWRYQNSAFDSFTIHPGLIKLNPQYTPTPTIADVIHKLG